MPGGMSQRELDELDSLVTRRHSVKRGENLFQMGQDFECLYAIRSGFFKTTLTTDSGHGQVTGFQIPGEVLGLDGVSTDQHSVDATALEDSEVCIMLYTELERIARDSRPLQRQLHRVMSREIVREHGVMMLLGSMRADQRVAAFLLNLSERYKNLGYSPSEFVLRMTRDELGSYLGLKLETVSRTLSRFQEQQIINAKGKQIKLLNIDELRTVLRSSN